MEKIYKPENIKNDYVYNHFTFMLNPPLSCFTLHENKFYCPPFKYKKKEIIEVGIRDEDYNFLVTYLHGISYTLVLLSNKKNWSVGSKNPFKKQLDSRLINKVLTSNKFTNEDDFKFLMKEVGFEDENNTVEDFNDLSVILIESNTPYNIFTGYDGCEEVVIFD